MDLAKIEKINALQVVAKEMQIKKFETMKADFPKYMKRRQKEFAKQLKAYIDENGYEGEYVPSENTIPLLEITEFAFKPLIKSLCFIPSYSASEMQVAFEYYKKITYQLNKLAVYPPKVADICSMLDISMATFENYRVRSSDEYMREVCNKIVDFCVKTIDDAGFSNKANTGYAIFHQKALNKLRDNDPVKHNTLIQNNGFMSEQQLKEFENKFDT